MTSTIPKPGPGPMHVSNPINKKDHNAVNIKTEKYSRKPFEVEAVRVTEENFNEIASWCNGTIVTSQSPEGDTERYIRVDVSRPLNERQTKAYVGDWLLEAFNGFKVYANGPFSRNFVKGGSDTPQELMVTDEVVE